MRENNVLHDFKALPKHIAFTGFSQSNQQCGNYASTIKDIVSSCFRLKIPMLSFYLMDARQSESADFDSVMDCLAAFFTDLASWDFLDDHKVKVYVSGKWYDLPGRVVDPVKRILDHTKDYDNFFLNFCVNYDGQEEIVAASQIIARLIKAEKLEPEVVDKATIKENLYSSYFIPPDLIVIISQKQQLDGILLWDSRSSYVYFLKKSWPEFSQQDLASALDFYAKDALGLPKQSFLN